MQWWCAAGTAAWDWSWRAYPGVWLFMIALGALYLWLWRAGGAGATPAGGHGRTRWRRGLAIAGLAILWIALDWPVGALGAGYLSFVHMIQFLLIAMAAPPLLLAGLPPASYERLRAHPRLLRGLRHLTQPLVALLLFTVVVVATHLPVVVDRLMATQVGSLLIDLVWLGAGIVYWWPVVAPVPERPGFAPPLQIGYLIANMILMTAPGALLTFNPLPTYAIYELAPRIGGFPSVQDQQIAGILMKMGGGFITWTAISVIFFRWQRRDAEVEPSEMPQHVFAGR